ncbi:MAG: hypothetical protein WC829_17790 [Hyphomicrobium sp.]|jgi:hypothetical protein
MNKSIIIALAAAAAIAAGPAFAADAANDASSDSKKMDGTMQSESSMNPTAGNGAPADVKPGTETSDRTPQKDTKTPLTQVDRSKSGETSDRTPSND